MQFVLVVGGGTRASAGGAFVCRCTFVLPSSLLLLLFPLCTCKVNVDHILIVLNCLRVLCEIRKIHAKCRKNSLARDLWPFATLTPPKRSLRLNFHDDDNKQG